MFEFHGFSEYLIFSYFILVTLPSKFFFSSLQWPGIALTTVWRKSLDYFSFYPLRYGIRKIYPGEGKKEFGSKFQRKSFEEGRRVKRLKLMYMTIEMRATVLKL